MKQQTSSLHRESFLHRQPVGSLVIFSPPRVSAAQEVFWYAVYAAALWIAVAFLALVYGAKAWSPYKTSRSVGDSAGS